MSDNVYSRGILVPLKNKITNDERNQVIDFCYENDINININYEGTIIFSDIEKNNDFYYFKIENKNSPIFEYDVIKEFKEILLKFPFIEISPSLARLYSSVWFNGGDSPMSEVKLDEFLKK